MHFNDDVAFCDGGGSLGRNTLCRTQVKERVNGMRNRAAEASVVFKKHQKSRAADGTISIMKHQRRLWCFLMTTLPSATVVGLWVTAPYVGHEIARANGVENRAAKCSASHKKHQRRLWCILKTTLPSATVVGLWVATPYVGHK